MGRSLATAFAVLLLSGIVLLPAAKAQIVTFAPVARPELPDAEPGDVTAIKTVAVISAIGQTYQLQNVAGFWGLKSKTEDIAAWNLDDLAVETVKKLLSARFAFKDVGYDRLALARIPNRPMHRSESVLKTVLSQVPTDGLDAFIVLRPDLESHGGEQGLAYGSGQTLTVATADYEIDIVDAHTLKVLARSYARVRTGADGSVGFATLYLGSDMRVEDNLAITDDQRARLRGEFSRLIDLSVLETLRSLSLGIELPPPASIAEVPAIAR